MIVIKSVDTNYSALIEELINVDIYDSLYMGNQLKIAKATQASDGGEILLKVVCPTLVKKYLGINLHPEKGVTLALFSPKIGAYLSWDGAAWIEQAEPVYQTLVEINAGIDRWAGDLQIRLHLAEIAEWRSLDLAYEVGVDLADWILRFGLKQYLSEPLKFSYVTTCSDGLHVQPPPYVDLKAIKQVEVQPFQDICYPATVKEDCAAIVLDTEITPGGVQVHYQLTPKIDYIHGEHQISESPCVTLRSLGEHNRRQAMGSYQVNGVLYQTIYNYDLHFELVIIADDIKDVRTISHAFLTKMRTRSHLAVDPFDLSFGVETMGVPNENPLTNVIGDVPSVTILGRIRNLFVSELANPEEYEPYL